MKVFLLLAAGMAVAKGSNLPPPPTDGSRSGFQEGLLSSLLEAAGYSNTCVADALDYCASEQTGNCVSLMKEVKEIMQQINQVLRKTESRPRHCKDLLDSGDSGIGLREIYPYSKRPHQLVTVYCDHSIGEGGWTIIQRRINNTARTDFSRGWLQYKSGFGKPDEEFWLGLDLLHEATSTAPHELRVQLDDYEGAQRWANYRSFQVGPPETNYRLTVGGYTGNAGDGMTYHNGSEFSTPDADHDECTTCNCAERYSGGWWYNSCYRANLNGYQYVGNYSGTPRPNGIAWRYWKGDRYSLRGTSMMIRPVV